MKYKVTFSRKTSEPFDELIIDADTISDALRIAVGQRMVAGLPHTVIDCELVDQNEQRPNGNKNSDT